MIKSNVLPLPAEDALRLTLVAASLRNTLPEVLAEMLALLASMRAPVELPIFPDPEVRETVVAVRVPPPSEMAPLPSAFRLMVEIVPLDAATLPVS